MKNYFKKSLSLLMAVLMLMTCWVWVTPEKAEAGAPDSYDVSWSVTFENQLTESSSQAWARIYHSKASNGSYEDIDITTQVKGKDSATVTVSVTGFPTQIQCRVYGKGAVFGEKDVIKGRWANYYINGKLVAEDGCDFNKGGVGNSGWGDWMGPAQSNFTETWVSPFLNAATATLDPASVTLAKINTGTSSTTKISLGGMVDQYGVTWSSPTTTFTRRVDEGITLGSNATMTGSGTSRTITINPSFQTLYPDKQSGKLYIDWTATGGTGSKSGTETITVTFPTYTATFDANGGKIGADDSEQKDQIVLEGDKMNYGSVIGTSPAYRYRDGFEFKGFYSVDNADALGLTASFSGTLFKDNETTVTSQGDTTWYAAWQAKTVTATFVTADNQLIGTVEGRYNNYLTASNMYNGDAGLNAAVKASHTTGKVTFNSNNEPVYTDGSTTYTFAGWKIIKAYSEDVMDKNEDTVLHGDVTFQAVYTKADAATYTVSFEDGAGNVISTQSGYKYRDDVTNIPATDPTMASDDAYDYEFIGWAKDIGKNFYAVDEYDCDENGAKIVYTAKDGAEFIVKGDASYVPVFRMVNREYIVTYKYTVDGNVTETTTIDGQYWHATPEAPEIKDNYTADGFRYYLLGWDDGSGTTKQLDEIVVVNGLTLTAVYGNAEAAKYTINFYGKDTDGVTDVLLNADSNIYEHNNAVTAPAVPQTIDTEDALYTFAGWSPAVTTTAGGDVDYYATYTKKTYADIHFYNYDGTLIYETIGKDNSLFVGETIPAYSNLVTGEDGTTTNALPEKAEDVIGTYNFTGWADGNGDTVVPGTDIFTGDTYLYAQFETVYKEYTVKFINEEAVVSEVKYHYGEEITVPENPTKAADVEYIYDFRAWTPVVSEVCYGDATYEATYRRTPQYYTVTWLNDAKAVHTESNYQYNAKIQQAVINQPVNYGAAATGKTWAFKHWVQCDVNGNDILVDDEQVIFIRGQRMGSEHLYFYPVFEQIDNVLTVKFYKEDGTSYLGEAKIPYGAELDDYADAFKEKAPKLSDDDYHYIIENWVNIETDTTVKNVTADVSVKATYTAEEHDKKLYEVIAEPTCNVPGYGHYKCEASECTSIDYNVAIAPVADEAAPTGQIYVGTTKWTLENYEDGIDYDTVTYINPNTSLIVNAEDTGTYSEPWNLEAELSRGVGTIGYYVANGEIDPDGITDWTEIYNYEEFRQDALTEVLDEYGITLVDYNGYIRGTTEEQMKKAEIDRTVDAMLSVYNANVTDVASNLGLENGKTYVIYIRVTDREGNGEVNDCVFSSGTIAYGTTAPEITVSGDGYGTKFCADATITVTDDTDGYKAYLDDEEITLTDGSYKCEEKGLHTVTVIDKHGNKTSKTFEIKGAHNLRSYTIAASCENAGSKYDACTLCGAKANKETIPAIGHSYTVNYIDKAADCLNDGYRTYVCDNNCGTKLVLKPTDDADKLAQAKKYVEPATEDEEGTWVALTADDIKHLKSSGTHTYAKVLDENGNETEEDAWVIDKAATCSATGSKHRDCTICGAVGRETAEIPADTENGHKFYREKVTLEPTCTAQGEKTKTCRYCGKVEHVSYIDALGHTAGEYRVITEATCEAVGSQILTCATCSEDIGEPVEDADGTVTGFDGEAVEIAALDHAWKLDGEIYEGEGENAGKYYQDYVCKNDATHKKTEEVEDYEPPVAATVTFVNGDATHKTVSAYVGEYIAASEVEAPAKQSDATKKYIFSHWADVDGKEVEFPVEVKGDATYTAVYTEKYINYTITYYNEDGTTEYKKVGYLHNGEEVELIDGPAKAETNLKKYVFAGWKDINGTETYTDKLTIDGADISLKATYKEVDKQYAVTYAYSSSDIIHTYTVTAGQAAPDVIADFGEITKDYGTKYHYEFTQWNRANDLAAVKSNIYTTPEFESVLHSYLEADGGSITLETEATCTSNAVYKYICACGYSYTKEEANTALGHSWGDPVYDETTGKNNVTCQREGCGTTQVDTRTFTVKFFTDEAETQAIKTVSYIPWGTTVEAKLPGNPSKASTATHDYTFKGWAVKGTTDIVDFAALEIKQDYEFVAIFTETVREYNVIFAYDAYNVIKTYKNIKAGDSVTFDGTVPVKACDVNYHYSFSGWKGYEDTSCSLTIANVQSDLYITATFKGTKHTYTSYQLSEATCTNGTGTRYYCDCNANGKFDDKVSGEFVDYYYDVTGKPLPHDYAEIERKEATPNADGYIKYECKNCFDVKTEELKYVDNVITIQVTVTVNGAVKSGVQVELQPAGGVPFFVTTNANGVANAVGVKGTAYTCYATIDGDKVQIALTADADGNLTGSYNYVDKDADCSCACHRDNFWGAIFRFFHKIIKLFTGEFKCCGNPDPMYG